MANRTIQQIQYTNGIGQSITLGSTQADLYRLIDPMPITSGVTATSQFTRAYGQNGQTYTGNTVFDPQDMQLNFMIQYKNQKAMVKTNDSFSANFLNKISGRMQENAHTFFNKINGTQLESTPYTYTTEMNQLGYTQASTNDSNGATSVSPSSIAGMAQHIFAFDVIAMLTNRYGEAVWQGATARSDKANLAAQYITSLAPTWYGSGSTSTSIINGHFAIWNDSTNGYDVVGVNTTSSNTTPITATYTSSQPRIDSNGMVNLIAYSPSVAVGATSTIVTNYIYLAVTVNMNINVDPLVLPTRVFNPAYIMDANLIAHSYLDVFFTDGTTYRKRCSINAAPTFLKGFQNQNSTWQNVQVTVVADDPFWYIDQIMQFDTTDVSNGSQNIFPQVNGVVPTGFKLHMNAPYGGANRTGVTVTKKSTGDYVKQARNSYTTDVWIEVNTHFGQKAWNVGALTWSNRFADIDYQSTFFQLDTGVNEIDITLTTGYLASGWITWKDYYTSI